MADIFISYKRQEQAEARRLIEQFEAAGFSVWWDDRISPDGAWDQTIEREINAAKAVVVLWTPMSVNSDWVRTEAHFASDKKMLVPVLMKPCTIPLAFSLTQAADLTRWDGDPNDRQWRKCLTWVSDLVGSHNRRTGLGFAPVDAARREAIATLANGEEVAHGATVGPTTPAGVVFADGEDMPVMRVLPAGRFQMGSPNSEKARSESEGPQHWVTIPAAFAIGVFPITVSGWRTHAHDRIDHKPRTQGWGDGAPVVDVSWLDASAFAEAMSAITGALYRLPSEAEWEYACRAGVTKSYPWGDDISSAHACFESATARDVGLHPPNAWGLFDMNGNVREWCADLWRGNYVGAPGDGSAWTAGDGSMRVTRGGAWCDPPALLRSASRARATAGERSSAIGLRLVREL